MKNTNMKKKHFVIAFVIIALGTAVGVFARNDFATLPGAGFLKSFAGLSPAPARKTSVKAFVHDDEPPTSGTFTNTLSNPQISQHQDGDAVIVMKAEGELPGTLTLKLQRDASGNAISGGEWAFLVSYTEETHNEDGTHGESLVQRGTVKGVVTGGQVTLGEDGSISAVDSVQLSLNGGTLTFEQATTGNGNGQVANLQDAANATGSLTLTF